MSTPAPLSVASCFMRSTLPKANLLTRGGRVLACSAFGQTFKEAWGKAYQGIVAVKFEDAFYRKDIGLPGAAESGKLS